MLMMMKKTVMMMTTTMMTMNDDDDDDDDDDNFGGGGGGGGNGDVVLHDKTVKDNASSRFLLVHTCAVSLFSLRVIKLCACLFLDLFHTIYRNTRVLFGSFTKCGDFAFLFGFILGLK